MSEPAPELVETILLQYRDFQNDEEFTDPAAVAERLMGWLADLERSPHFKVRVRRRYEHREAME